VIHLISLPIWFSGAMFVSMTNCPENAEAGKHSFCSKVIFCHDFTCANAIPNILSIYLMVPVQKETNARRKKRQKSQN
jgi:hypothetical protein